MNQYELQQEIYSFLVDRVSVPVYDRVPEGKQGNYIKIGDTTTNPHFTDETFGSDNVVTIHIYSNHAGKEKIKSIMNEIFGILNRNDEFNAVTIYCDHQQTFDINDGKYSHGIMRFRVIKEL